jgi:hypothetical protein
MSDSFVRLGRPVTFDDLIAIHRKDGVCEHCLGSARIRKHHPASKAGPARISVDYCYLALQDLQAEGVHRICEHPTTKEAHWLQGCAPEDWGFMCAWIADDFMTSWRRAFSHHTRHLWRRSG